MQDLFSIGQFAKLCHTTKDTLIHYDDVGLLRAHKLPHSNRRYYSFSQCNQFFIIQLLREFGLPINEIKQITESDTPEQLSKKLNIIHSHYHKLLDHLESAISYTNTLNTLSADKQLLCPVLYYDPDDKYYFVTNTEDFENINELGRSFEHHITACANSSIHPLPSGVVHVKKKPFLTKGSFLFFSSIGNLAPDNTTFVRHAGMYAALIHQDSFDTLPQSVLRLENYIHESKEGVPGDTYIFFYSGPSETPSSSFYYIEISVVKNPILFS